MVDQHAPFLRGYGVRALLVCVLPLFLVALSGCTPVKPWEKEYLAKPIMAFDPDPLETKSKQHLYFSKEGSSGGYGIGGGGCGCN